MFLVCSGVRVLMRATGVARGPGRGARSPLRRPAPSGPGVRPTRAASGARRPGRMGAAGEQGAAAARGHERAHRHAHARAGDENTGDERSTPQSMALGRADRHPVNRGLFFPLVLAGWTMKWVSSTMATTRR